MADDGDFLMEEEPDDQGSNEPNEAVNSMASKIPEEDAAEKSSSPQNEEIPEEPKAYAESSAEPLPKVPKNIVTSWSDWVAKTKTTVNQVNKEVKAENASQSHASQSQVRK